jgi:adenosylhomocysteine nucleosidase
MLLRWLVGNYVQSSAAGQLREVAQSALAAPAGPREAWQRAQAAAEENPEVSAPACDVALVFALGIEAGGVVDALESSYSGMAGAAKEHLGRFAGKRTLVIETGVGQSSAEAATQSALDFYRPAWVISAGFAGALSDDLPRSRIVISDEVAKESGERLPLALPFAREEISATRGLALGRLVTVDRLIRLEADKRELGQKQAANACDMETFAVAQACAQGNAPCLSIRIISDGVADTLPPEVSQLLEQGNWLAKLGTLSGSLFRRPSVAKDLWELQGRAVAASDKLARFLASIVSQIPGAPPH